LEKNIGFLFFGYEKHIFPKKKKPNFLRFYGLKSAESNNKKRAQI